ncbi:cohesin subunit SA-1 [Trichonephila clavipes]|nr:cohesin subunit SA-1 [Trichonephila clavipes]
MDFTEINSMGEAGELLWHIDREHSRFRTAKTIIIKFGFHASFVELESAKNAVNEVKNRDAVAALHREGILFTVTPIENPADPLGPPPNLAFLEILTEFTNKLMKLDKRVVLNYLDRHIQASMPGTRTEDWQPLILYRNSLVHGETEQPPPRAPGRQYRGRKRAREDDDPRMDDEGNMDQDSDRGSEN